MKITNQVECNEATQIGQEKVGEILELIPGFKNEIDWKKTNLNSKDYMRVVFKNGSVLDIVAASQRTRGARRHGGLVEEASRIALIYLFPFISGGQIIIFG